MRNPYDILGLKPSATEAEVKKAYRKLAKQHHPDQNRDDPKAKDRFAELNGAYEILGDAGKRKAFDAGEIDADGKPRFQGFPGGGSPFGAGGAGADMHGFEFHMGGSPFGRRAGSAGGQSGFDPGDIFSDLFGGGRARGARSAPMKGEDVAYELKVTLEEIISQRSRRITLPTGRDIEVNLPRGVSDGQTIRLRGLGEPSRSGGEPGDALMTVRILPHPHFTAEGTTLRTRAPLDLETAVLGGTVRVPTLEGEVEMTVPPRTSGGRSLRLRGKGLPAANERGDLIVALDVTLPREPDHELEAFMKQRRAARQG